MRSTKLKLENMNKKLKQKVKVLTSGEVPTNERLKLHTMAAALTAWKAENAAAWGADGFDELELEDFQEEVDDFEDSDEEEGGEAEEEGDHVPGGADPAPGVPLAGAGGDIADVLANLAKLLGKDDKPVLTKFNKDMEWDTWYALYQVWEKWTFPPSTRWCGVVWAISTSPPIPLLSRSRASSSSPPTSRPSLSPQQQELVSDSSGAPYAPM